MAPSFDKNRNRIAVQDGMDAFTYAELDKVSDEVAYRIREHGIEPGSRIAVHTKKPCGPLHTLSE